MSDTRPPAAASLPSRSPVPARGEGSRPDWRSVGHGAAFLLAFGGALLASRGDAGLAGPAVLLGLATAVPLYLAGTGWRLPWWLHTVAAALPAGVVVAALAHGYGDGAARASRYAWGALLLLALIAWARTPARRLAAAVGLLVLVADQYLTGWWIWWGQGSASRLMTGNYYWHNQFGIAMAIGIAVAAALVVASRRVPVLVAFVVGCLAAAGVAASASRAAIALAVASVLIAVVLGLIARRWRGLVRAALLVAGMVATSSFMVSSVFFPVSAGAPGGGLGGRSPAESSWNERVSFWVDALRIGAESPLIGRGLQSFGPHVQCLGSEAYSSNPHNEFALAWAETGIVGTLPFLALLALLVLLAFRTLLPRDAAVLGARRIRFMPSGEELRADPARWGSLVAIIIAVGHAAFDFDWSYPALLALAGIVGGIAAAPLVTQRTDAAGGIRRWIAPLLALALLGAGVVGFALDPLPAETLRPLPIERVDCG